uniref:Uncharacterized protein n=1 Tax=Cacopsylla melanoneura TaxID=428564 RepID=A0A8D9ALV8_9HEMI
MKRGNILNCTESLQERPLYPDQSCLVAPLNCSCVLCSTDKAMVKGSGGWRTILIRSRRHNAAGVSIQQLYKTKEENTNKVRKTINLRILPYYCHNTCHIITLPRF